MAQSFPMQKQTGSETVRHVLDPTVPANIGVLSQRQRILEAMIASCAEKTYPATTIADIVARASVSRTTFYKRFSDKRECFDAALDACVEEVSARAIASHRSSDPPAEAVRKAIAAILQLFADKPALAQLVTGEAITVEPEVIHRYRQLLMPAVQALWDVTGEPGQAHSDPRLAFGRVQVLIFDRISAGEAELLPELLPEIVYIAILPFAGHEEALSQARLAGANASSNVSAPQR